MRFSVGMEVLVTISNEELCLVDNEGGFHSTESASFNGEKGIIVEEYMNDDYSCYYYQVQFNNRGSAFYLQHELSNKVMETPLWKVLNESL